jgi:hypothetical protein
MTKNGYILFTLLLTGFLSQESTLLAQSPSETDYFKDANGDTYHQIFLDFQAKEIIEIKYNHDSSDLEGELSSDGYSVIIKNYPGNTSVKLKLIKVDGEEKEVIKSKCYIDPVLLHLL